jgi:exopolyphosphatase/guanosine-5'-triphosphate,3'-diphosphate pyrophosphatase
MRQSQAISEQLAGLGITRIVSSPHLRCAQTVERLAASAGLAIEFDERIAEDQDSAKAFEVVREIVDDSVVVCSHGSVIAGLLADLEDQGAELETSGPFRCQRGSIWTVERRIGVPTQATYRPPPNLKKNGKSDIDRENIAVMDLGSTSFRAVLFEATPAGVLTQRLNRKKMLHLGAAIDSSGRIPEAVCGDVISAAADLGELVREAGARTILPVATAALREARNGPKLAAKIGKTLGAKVRIISGDQEARLLFNAFQRRALLPGQTALGFDLGGGSLELAVGDSREIQWTATLPIGVTRLRHECVSRDPMRKRDARRLRECLIEALEPHRETIARLAPQRFIASSGTARAFLDLARARRERSPDPATGLYEMSVRELDKLTRQLVRADHHERLDIPGLRKDRVDLMPTGGVLLMALAETLGIDAFVACDWGLREGVVLEYLRESAG